MDWWLRLYERIAALRVTSTPEELLASASGALGELASAVSWHQGEAGHLRATLKDATRQVALLTKEAGKMERELEDSVTLRGTLRRAWESPWLRPAAKWLGIRPTTRTCPFLPAPFIVGVERSGTTLLRLMRDAHPQMAIPPETGFLALADKLSEMPDLTPAGFVDTIKNYKLKWGDYGIATEDLVAALSALQPFNVASGYRTFFRLYAAKHHKSRWGDKTPNHGRRIEVIARLIPEARFIHLIRDGRDVALSQRRAWFASSQNITELAHSWGKGVTEIRQRGRAARHHLEIRYEDLLADPAGILQRICRFLDLPCSPAMLRYHEQASERILEYCDRHNADGTLHASATDRRQLHRLASKPPDLSRAGAWQAEMNAKDIADFEAVAGHLLRELRYDAPSPL